MIFEPCVYGERNLGVLDVLNYHDGLAFQSFSQLSRLQISHDRFHSILVISSLAPFREEPVQERG
jgi:hypothetical protein